MSQKDFCFMLFIMIWEIINILIGYAFLRGAVESYKRLTKHKSFWILLVICSFFSYIYIVGTLFRMVLYITGIINTEFGNTLGGLLLMLFAIPYVFILRKYLRKSVLKKNGKSKQAEA